MKQSPAAVGWWALSARKHRRVPPAPPCTSPTCSTGALPTCQQTPALFLAPWALRWELHWGLPSPLVASTLVLPGRVTCQCHTATPATGALQGLVLVCNTSADMVWLMSNLRAPEAQTFPDACWDPCLLLHHPDTSSPRKPGWKGLYLVCTHSHTHTGCILAWRAKTGQGPTGLLCRISISPPDDGGGCVLSASFLNKPAQWAHLPGDSPAACRSGVADTQARGSCDKLGALNAGAWMSVAAGLLPCCLRRQVGPSLVYKGLL